MELRNRFVRSATYDGCAERPGRVSEKQIKLFEDLAHGGEGLGFGEGKMAAELLVKWGFDALEVSSGLRGQGYKSTEFRTKISRPDREAYFRHWCKEIRPLVKAAVTKNHLVYT